MEEASRRRCALSPGWEEGPNCPGLLPPYLFLHSLPQGLPLNPPPFLPSICPSAPSKSSAPSDARPFQQGKIRLREGDGGDQKREKREEGVGDQREEKEDEKDKGSESESEPPPIVPRPRAKPEPAPHARRSTAPRYFQARFSSLKSRLRSDPAPLSADWASSHCFRVPRGSMYRAFVPRAVPRAVFALRSSRLHVLLPRAVTSGLTRRGEHASFFQHAARNSVTCLLCTAGILARGSCGRASSQPSPTDTSSALACSHAPRSPCAGS